MSEIPAYIRVAAKILLCDLADHFDETRSRHAPFWSGDDTATLVAKAMMSVSGPIRSPSNTETPA